MGEHSPPPKKKITRILEPYRISIPYALLYNSKQTFANICVRFFLWEGNGEFLQFFQAAFFTLDDPPGSASGCHCLSLVQLVWFSRHWFSCSGSVVTGSVGLVQLSLVQLVWFSCSGSVVTGCHWFILSGSVGLVQWTLTASLVTGSVGLVQLFWFSCHWLSLVQLVWFSWSGSVDIDSFTCDWFSWSGSVVLV